MNKLTTTSGPTGFGWMRSLLAFRHRNPVARLVSTVLAFSIAMFLVIGSGAAYADDTAPAPADTSTTPTPDPTATDTPSTPPADPAPSADTSTSTSAGSSTGATDTSKSTTTTSTESTSTSSTPRSLTKTSTSFNTTLKVLAGLVVTVPCTGGPATVVGGFEIDGNLCAQGNLDWENAGQSVEDGFGDSTTFAGGTSEGDDPAGWALGGPTPNGKTDIGTVWAYSHIDNGTVYGYFGLTNDSTSGGTSQYDLEYNQLDPVGGMPNRSAGDLLFRFSSTGSDPIDFTDAKKWTLKSAAAWSAATCEPITATAGWCTIPIPANVFTQKVTSDGTFFEGAINISLLFGSGNCSGDFGSVSVRSVTGNSFYSSSLKDYVTPLSVDTPSTCGKLVINKKDENGTAVPGATFTISDDPRPGHTGAVTVKDGPTLATAQPGTTAIADPDGLANGVITFNPAEPGSYTVTEVAAPTGYMIDDPSGTSTNPQSVTQGGTATFNFVDHRIWKDLTASKTATTSYGAVYDWSVNKEISANGTTGWTTDTTSNDPLVKKVPDNATDANKLFYRVSVTAVGPPATSSYKVSGTITVNNPSDNVGSMDATVTDALPGATCLVDGGASKGITVTKGGSVDVPYVCTFAGTPTLAQMSGTNTAHVTWDRAAYPQVPADLADGPDRHVDPTHAYDFADAVVAETDKNVTVTDNQHTFVPAWTLNWDDVYAMTDHKAVSDVYSNVVGSAGPGTCSSVFANTATATGDGLASVPDDSHTVDSDSAWGQICEGSDLTVEGLDVEALTRTYPWTIDKSTSTPDIKVVDGKATATYSVTVTAGPGTDSAWDVHGTFTLANPNDWEPLTNVNASVDYVDTANADTCVVTEALPTTIGASSNKVFHYSCTFSSQPDYNAEVKVTATWDPAFTPHVTASAHLAVAEADWTVAPIDDTVTIHDDHANGEDHVLPGGNLTWATVYAMPGHSITLPDYSVDLANLPALGACTTATNTAWVMGDDSQDQLDSDTADVNVCNPYALVQALKVDAETQQPLAGAEFSLLDGDTVLGTATSGADGLAVFDTKLIAGSYAIKETKAPDGYGLPSNDTVPVTITAADLTNDVEGQPHAVLAPFTFDDPALGAITTLPKAQFERDALGVNWVPSDGVVDFGDEIRYVVNVESTGTKLFHDVTLTDYVPGYNPADTTTSPAGTKAELEIASITCGGGITCTSSFDAGTGLITWHLTEAGEAPGDLNGAASGWVAFVVRMPNIPATSPIQTPGTSFAAALWNQAYLAWTEFDAPEQTEHLSSNEVVESASATLPPEVKPPVVSPPSVLPNTGGPDAWLFAAGLVLLLGGGTLVASDRRRRRRS